MFLFVVTLLVLALATWYLYYRQCFTYWSKRGVAQNSPTFPGGNINDTLLGRKNIFINLQDLYNYFKDLGKRFGGIYFFNGPVFYPIDPDLIRHILVTDFEYFVDRGTYFNESKVPLSAHLFNLPGARWRELRNKLSPTFTSGKLKTMFNETFLKITQHLVDVLDETAENKSEVEINSKFILQTFTADIVCGAAFGMECKSVKNENTDIRHILEIMFEKNTYRFCKTHLTDGLQNPGNLIKALHDDPRIVDFFKDIVGKIGKYRETTTDPLPKDFFSLLTQVRDKEGLTYNEFLAQCFVFFVAGFETSSAAMTFCLHELAHNQDVQDRLRKEILENLGDDVSKFTYEALLKLPYLDQVLKETLRLYPVVAILNRICGKDYQIPRTEIVLEKGVPVVIPLFALHRDPEYFPDPLKFDPERFAEGNTHVPYTNMPFGEGPRICIGMRYGQLQSRLGLAAIISKFRVTPSPKTPKTIAFDTIPTAVLLTLKDGMFVKLSKV